jgi:hypothetical protein
VTLAPWHVFGTHASSDPSLPASGAPASVAAQTSLSPAVTKNVSAFDRQSWSPHSFPRRFRVHVILTTFSSCSRFPGQLTEIPLLLPTHVTLPSVELARRLNV